MFSTLVVVMVSWVYAYAQTHQDMYINVWDFLAYQLYEGKAKKLRI